MKRTALTLKALTLVLLLIPVAGAQTRAQTDERDAAARPVGQLPARPKRWALIIGVDQYKDRQVGQLGGAANDARTLADALVRYAGFPSDQVVVLATDQPEERQPTRVNILRRLSNLAAVVPKDALLLVSFAGHGMERNGQAFLLPSDAQISEDISFLEETAISVSRMKERIKATGVGQVLILLDACRNDPGGRADSPNLMTPAYTKFNFDVRNGEVEAFATIYATAVGQRAYEYSEKHQGYFTWALVEGLRGGAANERREVTLAGLVKFVQDTVPKRIGIDLGAGRVQRPFAVIEGYKAESLVLAVTGASAGMASVTADAPAPSSSAFELSYWDSIKGSNNPADFKAYLRQFPGGVFVALARNRLDALEPPRKRPDPTDAVAPPAAAKSATDKPVTAEADRPASLPPVTDVTGTTWKGAAYDAKNVFEGYIRLTFLKGGVLQEQSVSPNSVTTAPSIGTWSQSGDVVKTEIAKTKTVRGESGVFTLKGNVLEGERLMRGGGSAKGKALTAVLGVGVVRGGQNKDKTLHILLQREQ